MDGHCSVRIEAFAERHFIKGFHKKYQGKWDVTLTAIQAELSRIDALLLTDKADTIVDGGEVRIVKTEFRVAGTKESAKSSGNRGVVAWHPPEVFVAVLLGYSKTD